ncbi:MAG: DUF1800 domain-containing protein, partial [Bacteroidota bacterium]
MPKIKHLLNRASFGMSAEDLLYVQDKSLDQVIDKLFDVQYRPIDITRPGVNKVRKALDAGEKLDKEGKKIKRTLLFDLQNDWMTQMTLPIKQGNPFLERMSLFWHGHFACRIKDFRLASKYLENIRENSMGNFRNLLHVIAKDGSMIKYLNNQQNIKNKPNENFARELLELFSLGIGNYTEQDIKEAARAFTGWATDKKGDFLYKRRRHDEGQKVFFGRRGNFKGEEIIDIVLEKKEVAYFISTKIYQYFVNEEINRTHIEELSNVFFRSNYDIKTLMLHLFKSEWFYAPENIGNKIKSPIDLIVGVRSFLNLNFQKITNNVYLQRILGQELFNPPNVAGWNRDLKWINNSTLIYRSKLVALLLDKETFELSTKTEQEGFNFDKKVQRRFRNVKYNLKPV